MGMGDTYAKALQDRRGRGMNPTELISQGAAQEADPEDVRNGFDTGGPGETIGIGMPDMTNPNHDGIDRRLGVDQVPPDVKNHGSALKTPSDTDHTAVRGESASAAPQPLAQSEGMGFGDMKSEIQANVAGHASQQEYNQLKGMKPRSLGERAKMDALSQMYPDKK